MKKRGFTLIELIAVLAIMSICIGIGVFRLNIIDRLKASNEIQTMINDINFAKMKALSTGRPYNLILTKDAYVIKPLGEESKDQIIQKDLTYLDIGFNENNFAKTITYTASGSVNNAGTVFIKRKDGLDIDEVYKLVVTVAGGHSRIEKNKEWVYFD
ncbi:Tfp pilus assembly protein FimT/FimU [Anaerococcus sp. ENR1011]|uniref:Tfp pilus assembly protein FimT/FimU n=1 Tax=Anaerococcus groningensis TaxID=3115616 RepID=A0ABW9MYE4_9FIRM